MAHPTNFHVSEIQKRQLNNFLSSSGSPIQHSRSAPPPQNMRVLNLPQGGGLLAGGGGVGGVKKDPLLSGAASSGGGSPMKTSSSFTPQMGTAMNPGELRTLTSELLTFELWTFRYGVSDQGGEFRPPAVRESGDVWGSGEQHRPEDTRESHHDGHRPEPRRRELAPPPPPSGGLLIAYIRTSVEWTGLVGLCIVYAGLYSVLCIVATGFSLFVRDSLQLFKRASHSVKVAK